MPTEVFGDRLYNLVPTVRRSLDKLSAELRNKDKGDLEVFWDAVDAELETWETDVLNLMRRSYSVAEADEAGLRMQAYKMGIKLPSGGVGLPLLRRFLANSNAIRAWKGNVELLPGAIFLATGIVVEVDVPFHDANVFQVGTGQVGVNWIGVNWHPESLTAFQVGYGMVGLSEIGSSAINPEAPFIIRVLLSYDPGPAQLARIRWVVDSFKRAVDILEIVIPDEDTWWTVSSSRIGIDARVAGDCFQVGVSAVGGSPICADPASYPLLRIILPDGTPIEDL